MLRRWRNDLQMDVCRKSVSKQIPHSCAWSSMSYVSVICANATDIQTAYSVLQLDHVVCTEFSSFFDTLPGLTSLHITWQYIGHFYVWSLAWLKGKVVLWKPFWANTPMFSGSFTPANLVGISIANYNCPLALTATSLPIPDQRLTFSCDCVQLATTASSSNIFVQDVTLHVLRMEYCCSRVLHRRKCS